MNFFDLAGSDVNISDESSEGAEDDSTAVCDDRGYGLKITGLKIIKLEETPEAGNLCPPIFWPN